jgi:hypothetical protein
MLRKRLSQLQIPPRRKGQVTQNDSFCTHLRQRINGRVGTGCMRRNGARTPSYVDGAVTSSRTSDRSRGVGGLVGILRVRLFLLASAPLFQHGAGAVTRQSRETFSAWALWVGLGRRRGLAPGACWLGYCVSFWLGSTDLRGREYDGYAYCSRLLPATTTTAVPARNGWYLDGATVHSPPRGKTGLINAYLERPPNWEVLARAAMTAASRWFSGAKGLECCSVRQCAARFHAVARVQALRPLLLTKLLPSSSQYCPACSRGRRQ